MADWWLPLPSVGWGVVNWPLVVLCTISHELLYSSEFDRVEAGPPIERSEKPAMKLLNAVSWFMLLLFPSTTMPTPAEVVEIGSMRLLETKMPMPNMFPPVLATLVMVLFVLFTGSPSTSIPPVELLPVMTVLVITLLLVL